MTFLLALLALSPAVAPAAAQPPAVAASTAAALVPVPSSALPDFKESFKGRAQLIQAAKEAIAYLKTLPPNKSLAIAGRSYAPAALIDSARAMIAIARAAKTQDELAARVRETFDAFRSVGLDGQGRVIFSSYYEPVLPASLRRAKGYPYPLYRRPPDMVEVDLGAFGLDLSSTEPSALLGRVGRDGRVSPYFTREDIDRRKALAGRGLEIAWLKDRLEALDLHIQGSGLLRLRNGREVLARYAGTNGLPFGSVGLALVRAGVFKPGELTHTKLHDYLRKNPDAVSWILSRNPRYTFFELAALPPGGEPAGAAGEPLVPARTVAVDPGVVPLGVLLYFSTVCPQADKNGRLLGRFPTERYAFALDTGGAIQGPGRVDIYAGHGPQAETTARYQWDGGALFVLVKKLPDRSR